MLDALRLYFMKEARLETVARPRHSKFGLFVPSQVPSWPYREEEKRATVILFERELWIVSE
jgi:hypothetical protein